MFFFILSQISQISQNFFCSSYAGLLASRAAESARGNCWTLLITFFNVDNSVDKFFEKFCAKVGISGKKCIILKPEKFVYKWIIR